MAFKRITTNPRQMGGVPCVRGLRIPVATIVALIAEDQTTAEILALHPDLETEDIREALLFAAILLTECGQDAIHVRTLGLQHAEDVQIFDRAAADDRIVVSADTDFGTLLASRTVKKPSVIQFRGPGSRRPEALARAILANLPQIADALESGSIATFEP